ncbi:MAG: hypothetical protein MI757_08835 [Pirellulales bacterium]|nr:hypothetical protein [Pirellulales bacterium]
MQNPNNKGGDLVLQLLDSTQGRLIQTWQYRERTSVWIGRGEDNDITLADGRSRK